MILLVTTTIWTLNNNIKIFPTAQYKGLSKTTYLIISVWDGLNDS